MFQPGVVVELSVLVYFVGIVVEVPSSGFASSRPDGLAAAAPASQALRRRITYIRRDGSGKYGFISMGDEE